MIAPAQTLSDLLRAKGWVMASAESCTGGMIAAAITDLGGSSSVFDRGFVTYSNQAKMDMLGVSRETLGEHGAVSAQVAEEMASGALAHSKAHIAISVTGIAGPSGGSADKPVGLVYMGIAVRGNKAEAHKFIFEGDRKAVREQSVSQALSLLINACG